MKKRSNSPKAKEARKIARKEARKREYRIKEALKLYNEMQKKERKKIMKNKVLADIKDIVVPEKVTGAMAILEAKKINNRHPGETIFIYGNGPSLAKAIKNKKRELAKYISIGINVSYWLLKPSYLIFMETRKLSAEAVSNLLQKDYPVFTQDIDHPFPWFTKIKTSSFMSDDFALGCYNEEYRGNSLLPSINLAYIMGAKNIVLLGVDFHKHNHFYTVNKKYRSRPFFHLEQTRKRIFEQETHEYPFFDYIHKYLHYIESFTRQRGVKIWNCNPESAVKCFEYKSLDNILEKVA